MNQPCQIISRERVRELNCWNYLQGLTSGWSPSLPPEKAELLSGEICFPNISQFTCSLNLSERLRLASIKPDGESESDSRRCGTLARLFLRATRASTDLTNETGFRIELQQREWGNTLYLKALFHLKDLGQLSPERLGDQLRRGVVRHLLLQLHPPPQLLQVQMNSHEHIKHKHKDTNFIRLSSESAPSNKFLHKSNKLLSSFKFQVKVHSR